MRENRRRSHGYAPVRQDACHTLSVVATHNGTEHLSRYITMNVFDFDGTLYDGDSTLDFWLYSLRKYPWCIRSLPRQVFSFALFSIGMLDRESFKRAFYSFLRHIPDLPYAVDQFWDNSERKIRQDVLAHASDGDLVVSASPDFLVQEMCQRLSLKLIASRINPQTGELLSRNCRGEEKVRRLRTAGFDSFDEGYTDSIVDTPMMNLADRAFLVTAHGIIPFNYEIT